MTEPDITAWIADARAQVDTTAWIAGERARHVQHDHPHAGPMCAGRCGEDRPPVEAWPCAPTRALDALAAVLRIHFARGRNILGDPVCNECSPLQPMPCPTIRAMTGALFPQQGGIQ